MAASQYIVLRANPLLLGGICKFNARKWFLGDTLRWFVSFRCGPDVNNGTKNVSSIDITSFESLYENYLIIVEEILTVEMQCTILYI